ncbi:MAG: O-antigen ligase family protein [Ardenticatenaceae bacterium]|nr:O-antigen ligase family protein [Ardenticatenaceae bacterium]MCB9443918.1 O-antigen ligase family protein [Ardenticatenaceae bacterium]
MISKLQHLKQNKNDITLILLAVASVGLASIVSLAVNLVNNPIIVILGIVGLAGFTAIATRLEFGLFILIFITYTRLSDVLVHEHSLPSIAQPLSLLLLVIIVGRWAFLNEKPLRQIEIPLVLLGAYGLVGFAAMLYAQDTSRVQDALATYIKDVIITVLIIILLRRTSTFRAVIWTLLLAGIFMGSITAYQQLTGTYENIYWGFGLAKIQNIVGKSNDYRIAGPIGDPNFYGQILLVIIPLALERLWHENRLVLRILAGWALAVCLLSAIFTFSRGAFLGLIVIAALSVWHYRIRFVPLLITILLGSVLLQFVPEQYSERVQTMTNLIPGISQEDARHDSSFRGRLSETQAGWRMFTDHPLLGVGLNNYAVHYQTYSRQIGIDSRLEDRAAHNLYLEIAAETGLLGLFVFGTLLAFTFYGLTKAYSTLNQAGQWHEANMLRAFTIGLIGYLIAAFFLHAAYPRYMWLLLGIGMAISQTLNSTTDMAEQNVLAVKMGF